VTSERKLNANRLNARASTGPRTPAGKMRAARNGHRHGLNLSVLADPALAAEVKVLAREIAGEGANPELQELASRIAEAQTDLLRVRRARHALLSRALADPNDQSSAELAGQDKVATTFADCAAHLVMMDRYERRALSRRKFAIRAFDAVRRQAAA